MHIHHLIRGGLFLTGVGIGTICIAASAGAGSQHVASHAGGGAVAAAPDHATVEEALPEAPAAVPVLIEVPAALPVEEAQPAPDLEPHRPVVQAGPGPATPVPGATTLIDPLVIERTDAEAEA